MKYIMGVVVICVYTIREHKLATIIILGIITAILVLLNILIYEAHVVYYNK